MKQNSLFDYCSGHFVLPAHKLNSTLLCYRDIFEIYLYFIVGVDIVVLYMENIIN